MTEPSKPRLAIDLDDLERQLRRSADEAAPKKDPLTELARIVGQDDPFRKLLGESDGSASRAARAYAVQPPLTSEDQGLLHGQAGSYAGPSQGGGFDPNHYDEPPYEPLEPVHGGYADTQQPDPEPKRSRKGLFVIGAVLGVAALGAAGLALTRGGSTRLASGGEPPLVKADTAPSKIAPQNPGGVEIPNQNKQIFERGATDTQTRVVDRQEQPIDVRQAARTMPAVPPAAQGGSPSSTAAPGAGPRPNAVISALGEPRRVRTVAVKPDGSIDTPSTGSTGGAGDIAPPPPAPVQPATSQSGSATPSSPATPPPAAAAGTPAKPRAPFVAPFTTAMPVTPGTAPASAPSLPPPAGSRAEAPRTPARAEASRDNPSDPPPLAIPPQARSSAQAAARTPLPEPRTPGADTPAARPPAQVAARTPAAEPAARATASEPSAGGFSVQIGTRPSEAEARAAFDQLSARYATVLGGLQPLIRRTELNGKTVYRVRVGTSGGRAEAVDLCVRLKAAGGECFVAAN